MKTITAEPGPHLEKSLGISGPIPNSIVTLLPGSLMTILLHANIPEKTMFLCQKFFVVKRHYEKERITYEHKSETFVGPRTLFTYLSNGRLFRRTAHSYQVRVPPSSKPTKVNDTGTIEWVRMPPILGLRHHYDGVLVETISGWYGWGDSLRGTTAMSRRPVSGAVVAGKLVYIPSIAGHSILRVQTQEKLVLFVTEAGTYMIGNPGMEFPFKSAGDPFNYNTLHAVPTLIPNSKGIMYWHIRGATVFGWGPRHPLVAAGDNYLGQLCLPIDEDFVSDLTPVPLDRKFDAVYTDSGATFILAGNQCHVAGDNGYGRLGIPIDDYEERVPMTTLPFVVLDVISCGYSTVFFTGDKLLVCGNNEEGNLTDDTATFIDEPCVLTGLDAKVTDVALDVDKLYIKADGKWYERGPGVKRGFTESSRMDSEEWHYLMHLAHPVSLKK